jgi:hypothetical protein
MKMGLIVVRQDGINEDIWIDSTQEV